MHGMVFKTHVPSSLFIKWVFNAKTKKKKFKSSRNVWKSIIWNRKINGQDVLFLAEQMCVCVILNPNPLITLIFSIVQWIYCHFLPMNVRSDWWMNFSAKKKMTRWLCHTMYILSEKTIKKSTKSSDIIWIGYLFSKKKTQMTSRAYKIRICVCEWVTTD